MDLSLNGSNNVQESLMDISFPLSGVSSCVGSGGIGGISVGNGISVGSGVSAGSGDGCSGSSIGRGVGSGSSTGGSINNSTAGRDTLQKVGIWDFWQFF